jgi:hypothetical protein
MDGSLAEISLGARDGFDDKKSQPVLQAVYVDWCSTLPVVLLAYLQIATSIA